MLGFKTKAFILHRDPDSPGAGEDLPHTDLHTSGANQLASTDRPGTRVKLNNHRGRASTSLRPGHLEGGGGQRRGGGTRKGHVLYKTCFHHVLPWCPGLQGPPVLLCLNDVLGDCNPASPSPHRHLPAISECDIGHACRTRLSMRK